MSESPGLRESVGPARDVAGALDEDLYCLSCGYNLRGLSGDPVRCPECGQFNDLGTVRLPAEAIHAALRDMETAPTWCVASAVMLVAFSPLLLVGKQVTLIGAILMFCCMCGWFVAYREMRKDYDDRPGWRSILLYYHGAMALCLTVVLLPLGLWVYYDTKARIALMQRNKAVRVARETIRKTMQRYRGRYSS